MPSFSIAGLTLISPGQEVPRRPRHTLTIEGGRITGVAPDHGSARGPYAGCFALPGLIDMHVHLPPGNALRLTPYMASLYLRHGVTSVREAGDLDGTANQAARAELAAGRAHPRVFSCGPFVAAGQATFRNTILLSAPEDADEAARRIKSAGNAWLKSYDGLTLPMVRAVQEAAQRHGLRVMGHVPAGITYEDARVPDTQHFFGVPRPDALEASTLRARNNDWRSVDERRMDEIVEATVRYGIVNTPTMVVGHQARLYQDYRAAMADTAMQMMPPFLRDVVWSPERGLPAYRNWPAQDLAMQREAVAKKQSLTRKLYEAGATLHLGTDTTQPLLVPGLALHQEIALFHEAGIPMEDVLRMATAGAADALGEPDLGRIGVGGHADLALFQRDPTVGPDALASLVAVISAGKLLTRAELDESVAARQAKDRRAPRKQVQSFLAARAVARITRHATAG